MTAKCCLTNLYRASFTSVSCNNTLAKCTWETMEWPNQSYFE